MRFAENINATALKGLAVQIRKSWKADTLASEVWSKSVPEKGQCAVTALLVQDIAGGTLNRAMVNGESHYWNTLESGVEVDLTRAQFAMPVTIEETVTGERSYLLGNELTKKRYDLLKSNFEMQVMLAFIRKNIK